MFTYFESISSASHPPARQRYHPSLRPTARPPARPCAARQLAQPSTLSPVRHHANLPYNPQISLKAFQSIHFSQAMWYSSPPTGQTACSETADRLHPSNPTYKYVHPVRWCKNMLYPCVLLVSSRSAIVINPIVSVITDKSRSAKDIDQYF